MTIEQRILLLEAETARLRDHVAIYQILARYGPLADSADDEARRQKTGALFSENGIYDIDADWKGYGPSGVAEMLGGEIHRDLVHNGSAHVMSLPYVIVEGDKATALSYSQVYRHREGAFFVWRVAANHWELAREGGGWKVTYRVNRLLDGNEEARAILRRVDEVP
jgi:hypothetical protein